jgi:hypothetical protein
MIYTTCCVNSTAEAIDAMVENAVSITYRTFRKHCEDLDEWASRMGYDTGAERGGLRLSKDWAVSYHRSQYWGRPCYFLCHSAIEYIWT